MKYFSLADPSIVVAMNKLIRDKESRIFEEIQKVKHLKKVQAKKLNAR